MDMHSRQIDDIDMLLNTWLELLLTCRNECFNSAIVENR